MKHKAKGEGEPPMSVVYPPLFFTPHFNRTKMKRLLLFSVLALCLGLTEADAAKKQTVKRVTTAEEFIKALGNDTRIVIPEFTVLKLTPAIENEEIRAACNIGEFDIYYDNYEEYTTPRLGWSDQFDGKELDIAGFSNLTIEGEGQMAGIIIEPRYAYVLSFFNCKDITLRNLTLGHTDTGYCQGGVVALRGCQNTVIEGCDLYGCGTEGIGADRSNGLQCKNTIIRDCSYQIMTLEHCKDFSFAECNFYNCREFSLINVRFCDNVVFEKCDIHDNDGELFNIGGTPVRMVNCVIDHPVGLLGNMDMVVDEGIVWSDSWMKGLSGDYDEAEDHCADEEVDDDEIRFTDWDWDEKPVTLPLGIKKPNISDFLIALSEISRSTFMMQAGAAVSNPAINELDILEIDIPNGYILAGNSAENHLHGDYRAMECCYWRMNNGHSLLAINHLMEYDALSLFFYEYDPETHVLTPRPQMSPYEGLPVNYSCRHVLPRVGKSIQMVESGNLYHLMATQTWNGERFELKLTDEPSKFGGTPLTKGGVYDMISFIKKYYPDSFKE